MTTTKVRGLEFVFVIAAACLLAGCAGKGGSTASGSPENCKSIKAQLNQLDAKGVQAYVEAESQGKKLSPGKKKLADKYNNLLNDYLGARCHV
jgi:major membrane immunogen (membrane-anchored lipoprotein)